MLNRLVQHEPGQLDPVLDAVNQAGALPWKVNQVGLGGDGLRVREVKSIRKREGIERE